MTDEEMSDPKKVELEMRMLISMWENPQPGLIAWCGIERERLQTIFNLLHRNGFKPTEE